VTVDAYGPLSFYEESDDILALVSRLTDVREAGADHPWQVSDAPADYVRKQLGAIVGFKLAISRIEGKAKANQNRSEADRAGVAGGLSRLGLSADLVRDRP
jgi:transcriptional regulator